MLTETKTDETEGLQLLATIKSSIEGIGQELGREMPVSSENPPTLQMIREKLPGIENDIYLLTRYIYEWAIDVVHYDPPQGYTSWGEINKTVEDLFDQSNGIGKANTKSDIRFTPFGMADPRYPSIFVDPAFSLVTALGVESPYFLHYEGPESESFNRRSKLLRAYISLSVQPTIGDISDVIFTFTQLCDNLRSGGINFKAKCSSPSGAVNQADNIVFYFNAEQYTKMRGILVQSVYIPRLSRGGKTVRTAIPDTLHPGIAWGAEPRSKDLAILKMLTDKTDASYSMIVSMYALIPFIERLIVAHGQKGNTEEVQELKGILHAIQQYIQVR